MASLTRVQHNYMKFLDTESVCVMPLPRNYMSHLVGKPTMWFPNRSETNRPVQSQKRARILKFRIKVEEELYYPSIENKGTDQLRGYREADLCLCFCLCRLLVFPWGGSYNDSVLFDFVVVKAMKQSLGLGF